MGISPRTKRTRNKKPRVKPSSSLPTSFTTTCPNTSSIPALLPPARLHLTYLPALVHDAISSFLPSNDRLRVMEASPWASKAYGPCVKQLVIRHVSLDDIVPIQSILKRRPALVELTMPCHNKMTKELAEGSCDKLQRLELGHLSPYSRGVRACLRPLFDALGHGGCPNIIHLSLSFDNSGNQADRDNAMKDLGGALRSRMNKGCPGLKALQLENVTLSALSPVLSSGACDKLEGFLLEPCELRGFTSDALKEWLVRTKGPRLRALTPPSIPADIIEALSSPGVARGLQVLGLSRTSPEAIMQLSVSIKQGAWRKLRNLIIFPITGATNDLVSRLMEAIQLEAPDLNSLYLSNWCMGAEGAKAVAQSLRDGACPRLENLSLSGGLIGDVGVIELVKAFVEGAPCNVTLQRLKLEGCQIDDGGMEELARAVTRGGALPNLEDLQLGTNSLRDQGVVCLAEAMKKGGLSQLKKLGLAWTGMTSNSMLALSQALIDHHACPHLVKLDIRGTYYASDDVKRGLAER